MPSRQEQLHSYQFMVQRVVSALVLRETDPPQSPFRRAAGAAFASVLVAVVIAAGFGVYAIFTGGGNQKWRVDGAVVVEKETGAAFLFQDGKLYPALNATSAMIASKQAKPATFRVASRSLKGVATGPMIGIPYLPNSVATTKELVNWPTPWSVCAYSGKQGPVSAVIVGDEQVSRGRVIGGDAALVIKSDTKAQDTFVLWRGRLFEVTPALAAQLAQGVQPTVVVPAFINGLPRGEPIRKAPVVGVLGSKSRLNELLKVGEVFQIFGVSAEVGDRYVLVRDDGLFYVTQVQAQLADFTGQRRSYGEVTTGGVQIKNDLLPKDNDARQPPANLPKFDTFTGTGLCSVLLDGERTELRADVPLDLEKLTATGGRSSTGTPYADYVVMPHGKAAVVLSGQTYSYVSRDGVRFAAANKEVLGKLGYGNVNPVKLQSSLVALLPEGPGLDPTEVLLPVTVS